MKKSMLLVSLIAFCSICFSQVKNDTTKKAADTSVHKRDTSYVPVLIVQKYDTTAITAFIPGQQGHVDYFDGWIIRFGYYSESFEEKWRNAVDKVYTLQFKQYTGRLFNVQPRVTPEQIAAAKQQQIEQQNKINKTNVGQPPKK